jgi:hypothetical protein
MTAVVRRQPDRSVCGRLRTDSLTLLFAFDFDKVSRMADVESNARRVSRTPLGPPIRQLNDIAEIR